MKKIFTLISVALLCLSASAQVNLATAIEDAVKASSDEYCSVFLDHTKEYVLDSNVDLGLQKAVIWGCGAKVTVKGEGQLSRHTSRYAVSTSSAQRLPRPSSLSLQLLTSL